MNVPINIDIYEIEEKPGTYVLTADNYCPRRSYVHSGAYWVESNNIDELRELVKAHILPLYKIAFDKITGITNGTENSLYYWE